MILFSLVYNRQKLKKYVSTLTHNGQTERSQEIITCFIVFLGAAVRERETRGIQLVTIVNLTAVESSSTLDL